MQKSILALAALVGLAVAAPASAAQYMFDFSGTNLFGSPAQTSGSGIFTTSDVATQIAGRTAYTITGISGSVNGSDIVAPMGSYGAYFTTGPSFLDGSGTNFKTASGTLVSFFFQDNLATYRVNTQSPGASGFVIAHASAIGAAPEPASWALMIGGFGLTGVALRRRRTAALGTGALQA